MNSVNKKQGIILKGFTNLSKREKEDHTHEEEFNKEGEKSH